MKRKLAKVASFAGSDDSCSPLSWLGDANDDTATLRADNGRQGCSLHAHHQLLHFIFLNKSGGVFGGACAAILNVQQTCSNQ